MLDGRTDMEIFFMQDHSKRIADIVAFLTEPPIGMMRKTAQELAGRPMLTVQALRKLRSQHNPERCNLASVLAAQVREMSDDALERMAGTATSGSGSPGYQGPARMAFYESEEEFTRWWEGLSDRKQDDLLAEIMADADYAWLVAKHLKPWLAAMRPPTRGVRFSLAQISDRQADRIRRGERPKPMTRDEVRALAEAHGIRWWRDTPAEQRQQQGVGQQAAPTPKPAEGEHLALVGDVVGEIMAEVRRPVAAGASGGASGGASRGSGGGGVTVDDF